MRRFWRVICFGIVPLLLATSAVSETAGGLESVRRPASSAILVEGSIQLASAVLSVAALVALWKRRDLVLPLFILWGAAITTVASLAPVVYGGAPVSAGVSAGASTAVIVGLLAWAWQRHALSAVRPPSASGTPR